MESFVAGFTTMDGLGDASAASFCAHYKARYPSHGIVEKWGESEIMRAVFYSHTKGHRKRQPGKNYIVVKGNSAVFYRIKRARCVRCGVSRITSAVANSDKPICTKCLPAAAPMSTTSMEPMPSTTPGMPTSGKCPPARPTGSKTVRKNTILCHLCRTPASRRHFLTKKHRRNEEKHRRNEEKSREPMASEFVVMPSMIVAFVVSEPAVVPVSEPDLPSELASEPARPSEPDLPSEPVEIPPPATPPIRRRSSIKFVPDVMCSPKLLLVSTAPKEPTSMRCPKAGEPHPYLWDGKGNWPVAEPPLEINETNSQVLKLLAGEKSHDVECIEHNHRPYFLASHVCRMLGADLRPDGLPKSPQIRKKLLEPYDLGAIRVIRKKGGRNTRRLFFSTQGLLLYVIKTKVRSLVSRDLTRWVLHVTSIVSQTGYYKQQSGDGLPTIINAIRSCTTDMEGKCDIGAMSAFATTTK